MRRGIIIVASATVGLALTACAQVPVDTEPYVDPQVGLNELILREQAREAEADAQEREAKARRAHYQQLSNDELMGELKRICPSGSPPCERVPPKELIQEAMGRGLILPSPTPSAPGAPGFDCVSMGDGFGGAITDCDAR